MRCAHISRIGTRCTRIEGHFPDTPHVAGFTETPPRIGEQS